MNKQKASKLENQWAVLARNDWNEIVQLLRKKAFQRKFQILEVFTQLVAEKGFHNVTHIDIARKCRITRQAVDHHFPKTDDLVILCFRYIYARFQKKASDALIVRASFVGQLTAYIEAVADWVEEYQKDARFLVQYYALLHINSEVMRLHQRNLEIGKQRITALCIRGQSEGFFSDVPEEELARRASSVQKQLLGYVTLESAKHSKSRRPDERRELRRSIFSILELKCTNL